jgi:hypothetical protein
MPTKVRSAPVAVRSSPIVTECKSLTDGPPPRDMAGRVSVYVKGTPTTAVVWPAGFFLSIVSTGMKRS